MSQDEITPEPETQPEQEQEIASRGTIWTGEKCYVADGRGNWVEFPDPEVFLDVVDAMIRLQFRDQCRQWIAVEDHLPEIGKTVLTVSDQNDITSQFRLEDKFGRWSTTANITHWMPLPPLPEKVQP